MKWGWVSLWKTLPALQQLCEEARINWGARYPRVQGGQRGSFSLGPELPEVMTLASTSTPQMSTQSLSPWSSMAVGQEYLFQVQRQSVPVGWVPPPVVSEGSSVSCALSGLLLHQHLPGSNPHNSGLLWDLVPSVFPSPVGSLLSAR